MNKWVMCLIDSGYDRVWDTTPSVTQVMLKAKSALDHQDFVTKTICLSMSEGIWIDFDLATGLFNIPVSKWEALRENSTAILNPKGSRGLGSQACMPSWNCYI